MIFTLIVFLLIVVFMAFFVGKNLTNTCTLWLFKSFENLPVAVLVLIVFGAGIVFSLLLVTIYKFKKSVKNSSESEIDNQKEKPLKNKRIEKKIKEKKVKNVENSSDVTVIADK